jgi:hypothetical protein
LPLLNTPEALLPQPEGPTREWDPLDETIQVDDSQN